MVLFAIPGYTSSFTGPKQGWGLFVRVPMGLNLMDNVSHVSEIENLQDYLIHFEHLGMGSANGRWHYNVMLFIIGWALNKNDSYDYGIWSVKYIWNC